MLLLDEMELSEKKLKGTPKSKNFHLRKNVTYKQAVVKMLSTLNHKNIDYAMFYIAKHSEDFKVKDENGNEVKVPDVLKDWKKNMSKDERSNEAMHLSFSIDEDKTYRNYEALEKSVADVLRHNFYEHKYVYTVHKHQGKPHVHVIINKRSKFTNRKMNFKNKSEIKTFFKSMRDQFGENLNAYNEDFNYTSDYKVERDLKYNMLSKTIKDLEKKINLNNNMISQAEENIKTYNKELDDINNRIDINLKENINLSEIDHNRNLQKTKLILKRNKELTRIKKDLESNIKKQETIIHNSLFIIKESKTKDFVNIEHTIKFFESKTNKKNMTLRQYVGIDDLKEDFKELKHFYDIKITKELEDEKDQIQLLSMTTNAFKIYKLYKQAISREFENTSVIKNKIHDKQISENKEFLQKIFKERDHEVELMQRKVKRTLELLKDSDILTKKNKEKELNFLEKERNFIEQLKEYNHDLIENYLDKNRSLKNFKISIKEINEKTSIYKIQKNIIEKEYFLDNTKNKEDKLYLEGLEKILNKHIDTRALKNYRTTQYLKKELKTANTIKKKEETINTLRFLKEEKNIINKTYMKHIKKSDIKLYLSEFEQALNNETKETSIYKLLEYQEELQFRNKLYTNKDDKHHLEELKESLKQLIELRAFRNYQVSNLLKQKYKNCNTKEDKEKVLESIKFINNERDTIKKVYDKAFTKDEKKSLLINFEQNVHKLDHNTKSIYTIKIYEEERKFRSKFNIEDRQDLVKIKEIKEQIKFKTLLREDKVKNSIDYYSDQLNKDLEDKEIHKIKETLEFMKNESKVIKDFKQKNTRSNSKTFDLER